MTPRQMRQEARCSKRADQVRVDEDGTIIVPSVANDHNATVAAWARHLGVDLVESRMMIISAESGRCWIKYAGST
jgi:sugar diacid utilization regulator